MGAYIIRLGVKAVSHFWGISSEAISTFHVGGNLDGLLPLVDRAHDSEGFGVSLTVTDEVAVGIGISLAEVRLPQVVVS